MMKSTTAKLNQDDVIRDATTIFRRIEWDISSGTHPLPDFPETARHLQQLTCTPNYSFKTLAEAVEPDFLLTERLIRIASGSLYPGKEPCDTPLAAVRRLGTELTQHLALVYALSQIFQSDQRIARQKLRFLWQESARVAALAFWLAQQRRGFKPERAMLAGLLQNVGAHYLTVIMGRKARTDYHWLLWEQMIADHSANLSARLLAHWALDSDLITCAETRDQWLRSHSEAQPDLADLLIIARYHAYLNTDKIRHCPRFTELPCVAKLGIQDSEMTPFQGLTTVRKFHSDIDDITLSLTP